MARVLVVDDDAWAQRMLAAVLSHVGHQVGMAADGREGLLAAEHVRPELLIVKTRLAGIDGWELVGRLRARPELAAVPALFLVSGPLPAGRRGASFRADTDDLLTKPFSAEALQDKVERLLYPRGVVRARTPSQGVGEALAQDAKPDTKPDSKDDGRVTTPITGEVSGPVKSVGSGPVPTAETRIRRGTGSGARKRPTNSGIALVGRLDEFGAASILMLLELERRSGVLILSGSGGNGRVHVRRGRVLRANIEDRAECLGAAAVFQMLTWNGGRFEFHPGDVEGEDEVRSSTSFLLLEAARKQDEEAAAQKKQN
jgi:CheY-like chemotaxis protein